MDEPQDAEHPDTGYTGERPGEHTETRHTTGKPGEHPETRHTTGHPEARHSAAHLPDRTSAFFSALLNEQFVLESARNATVSESGTRASIYLTTLSSSLVAFGFLADTPFAVVFLAAVLPIVFLLGVFTYVRLVETSLEDVAALAALQQIRRYHRRLLPGAERYFPMPVRGHAPNEMLDIGGTASWRRVFSTLSSAIGAVNSMVAGAGVVALVVRFAPVPVAVGAGIAAVLVLFVLHGLYQERRYAALPRIVRAARAAAEPPVTD
ncbi:hypothetical protein [Curtobacterium sp. UCD-KPL2560]|uniref:hypothetical protein n=1 Tax=Curtobacterium sp. UCD-KPL2560 TaxID=1885315 RepID=UPI000826C416|nr:hypothetical protein [Curtobacterium sp. UCD-KPL2560]